MSTNRPRPTDPTKERVGKCKSEKLIDGKRQMIYVEAIKETRGGNWGFLMVCGEGGRERMRRKG